MHQVQKKAEAAEIGLAPEKASEAESNPGTIQINKWQARSRQAQRIGGSFRGGGDAGRHSTQPLLLSHTILESSLFFHGGSA